MNVIDAILKFPLRISFTKRFYWTGYTKPPEMKDPYKLLEAILTVYDKYTQPAFDNSKDVTYCNFAAQDVAESYGNHDLANKLANEIIAFMEVSPDWTLTPMEKAQELANQGSLVFATLKETPHGHICVIRPGISKTSGRWGLVPAVMNIGKDNFISKGLNWAFSEYPKLYAWRPSL